MKLLLLISTLIASCLCFAAGQSPCLTPNGDRGHCVSIFSCNSMLSLISSATPAQPVNPSYFFCGVDIATNSDEVCCASNTCNTPDGFQGTCVDLHSCPHLTKRLQPHLTIRAMQDVLRYTCGTTGSPELNRVCCGDLQPNPVPSKSIPETKKGNEQCVLTDRMPSPKSDCCGIDASNRVDKIVGGDAVSIDEYPWMALIEYRYYDEIRLMCGGVLISGQHVLTAGHCVNGRILKDGTPVNVRLGEYDTSNVGPDAVVVPGGGNDKTDGAVSIPINKTIPHPDYIPTDYLKRNDIALIKLAWIAQYTDFIRPICLPYVDFTTEWQTKVVLYTAGWGFTENKVPSNIKLKVSLPYVPFQECKSTYRFQRKRELSDGQICAGGEAGKDACSGDSGGPLMRIIDGRHELVGIVSFGPRNCGTENIPSVYTKVFHYHQWIKNEINTKDAFLNTY